ncbi:MAG: ABC transporter permease [Candidatus Latescibacterota bacterium]|nr:MAG: ABC transporter permease [Candidatus Latescibacterota bacterium]
MGDRVVRSISELGEISVLLFRVLKLFPKIHKVWRLTLEQMLEIGVHSMPLVVVTSFFTGTVTAIQAAYQFQDWIPLRYVGSVVGKSVIIELGPVLTGLVVGGRVGASIAAEIGTMKVTEQIDALEALAIDSIRYLVLPRFVAGIIMIPVVVIFADALAIIGALLASVYSIGISAQLFALGLTLFFTMGDVWGGVIKSVIFGGIIALMGCYYGLRTEGGAEGVGRAATQAVVSSCLLILISDYILAELLFGFIFAG